MTEDERLRRLLRLALPAAPARHPSRDLWPAVVERTSACARWSRFDIGLAAVVTIAAVLSPEALWLIAYHL